MPFNIGPMELLLIVTVVLALALLLRFILR